MVASEWNDRTKIERQRQFATLGISATGGGGGGQSGCGGDTTTEGVAAAAVTGWRLPAVVVDDGAEV
jgi:hypothetical protein